jgi:hypothetical protein
MSKAKAGERLPYLLSKLKRHASWSGWSRAVPITKTAAAAVCQII